MRRSRGLISQLNSLTGGLTHWTIRALLSFAFEKIGIDVHPDIIGRLAYVLTGLLLVGLGVWGYLYIKIF